MNKQVGLRTYLAWVLWVVGFAVCFVAASFLAEIIVVMLLRVGMFWPVQTALGALCLRLLVYVVMVGLLLFAAAKLDKRRGKMAELCGMGRMMSFLDIGLAIAGTVVYILLTLLTQYVLRQMPWYDASQLQQLGVSTHLYGVELVAAYVVLVIATPFFEELIFRGILYGQLRRTLLPAWATALAVSILFGLAHGQWNVGVDVFCLSLVACFLRERTGTIWPGVVIHTIKNGVAFWFIFVAAQSMGS